MFILPPSVSEIKRGFQPISRSVCVTMCGADGGTRTRTPVGEGDFKSPASAVSPRPQALPLILGHSFLRIAAEAADQPFQLVDGGRDPLPIGAAHHQRDAEIAAPEIGI